VIEAEVVPTSQELGISQIVWSPLAQGVLTGKYRPGVPLPQGTRATDPKVSDSLDKRLLAEPVLTAVQKLKPVADAAGLTMAQLAIAWVLSNPNLASAIMGASRPEQVTSNVAAAGVHLSAETLATIDEILGDIPERDPRLTALPARRPA
jgi:aryl-alcohol dehydrogenase-like predicted oxidoreductase